jgi:hypothetical protein
MTHRLISRQEFRDLIANGAITDSATLATCSLLALAGRPWRSSRGRSARRARRA